MSNFHPQRMVSLLSLNNPQMIRVDLLYIYFLGFLPLIHNHLFFFSSAISCARHILSLLILLRFIILLLNLSWLHLNRLQISFNWRRAKILSCRNPHFFKVIIFLQNIHFLLGLKFLVLRIHSAKVIRDKF